MKKIKIIKYTSDICWWMGSLGEECEVLEVYEPTGYIKTRLYRTDPNVIFEPTYTIEGYIRSNCVEIIEIK